MVIPLTSNLKNPFPSEFIISKSEMNGLEENSRFLGNQILAVDKRFFIKKIGVLEEKYYEELRKAIFISLDLNDDFLN